jgi:hypothetical protein
MSGKVICDFPQTDVLEARGGVVMKWQELTLQDQIEFFEANHYLVVPNALTAEEVATLNAAIDRDREQFPQTWSKGKRSQSAQCLLSIPEADIMIRHPSFFEVASHVFDGDIHLEEFGIMLREGDMEKGSTDGWHGDALPNPEHRLGIRALSSIFYLTDVDESTARYALVPNSQNQPEPKRVREDDDLREGEVHLMGPAGTAILVNAGNWHCGRWGHSPRERRSVHIYYGQSTTPNMSNHTIVPRRLWDVDDPVQREFYSKHNSLTRAVSGDYCKGGAFS